MDAPIIATIYGPKGRIHINHRAHNPESITLVLNGALATCQGCVVTLARLDAGWSVLVRSRRAHAMHQWQLRCTQPSFVARNAVC